MLNLNRIHSKAFFYTFLSSLVAITLFIVFVLTGIENINQLIDHFTWPQYLVIGVLSAVVGLMGAVIAKHGPRIQCALGVALGPLFMFLFIEFLG